MSAEIDPVIPAAELVHRLFRDIAEFEEQIRAFGRRIDAHEVTRDDDPQLQALDAHLRELDCEIQQFARQTDLLLQAPLDAEFAPIDEKTALFSRRLDDYSAAAQTAWSRVDGAAIPPDEVLDLVDSRGDIETRVGMLVRDHNTLIEGRKTLHFNVVSQQEALVKSKQEVLTKYEELLEIRHELSVARLRTHRELLTARCELFKCLVGLVRECKQLC